jgi:hypothetical protein
MRRAMEQNPDAPDAPALAGRGVAGDQLGAGRSCGWPASLLGCRVAGKATVMNRPLRGGERFPQPCIPRFSSAA